MSTYTHTRRIGRSDAASRMLLGKEMVFSPIPGTGIKILLSGRAHAGPVFNSSSRGGQQAGGLQRQHLMRPTAQTPVLRQNAVRWASGWSVCSAPERGHRRL